jgi:hypothetical protein
MNKNIYQQFKAAFCFAYTPTKTVRKSKINIHNPKQGPNESDVNF